MGNWKAFVPITLSVIIAVVGSYFIFKWIERQRVPKEIVQVQTDAIPLAVAASDLPHGTKLTPEMLKSLPYLKESLPTGYFSKAADLVGRVVITPLKLNEPITEHKLAPTSIETGGIAAVLKNGRRAVAVKGDKVIGLSGLVNPGNTVDVLVTIEDPEKKEQKTKIVLENIPVLATGTQIQENEKGEPAPVDVYTLEVTPEESEKLALAAAQGRIQLALRSVVDSEEIYTEGINIPQLLASYGASRPEPAVRYYPKPVERTPEPKKPVKKVRKWKPRRAISVEIIKGNEVQRKNFSLSK
jgi:pilus assembly protein CpaB